MKINSLFFLFFNFVIFNCFVNSTYSDDSIEELKPIVVNDIKKISRKEREALHKELKHLIAGKMTQQIEDIDLERIIAISLQLGWQDKALHYIDPLISKTKDVKKIKHFTIVSGDIYFEKGDFSKSAEFYNKFVTMYPGDKQVEYAHYKAILSSFYMINEPDRDQIPTHLTIKLAQEFLDNNTRNIIFKEQIEGIMLACNQRLFEQEKAVFDFYTQRGDFQAAQKRLAYVEDVFMRKIPSIEPDVMHCKYRLAFAQGDKDSAQILDAKLKKNFPEFIETLSKPVVKHVSRF